MKLYNRKKKDKLYFSQRTMIGWARQNPSRKNTPSQIFLPLGMTYYFQGIGWFDKCIGVLIAFDCHLCVRDAIVDKAN